jgi:hypothetical protein
MHSRTDFNPFERNEFRSTGALMRCPVCRADNEMPSACRRCRADLSLLWALENQRDEALAGAVRAIAQGQAAQAARLADQAHNLRAGPDSLRALAWGHLLEHDFAAAWRCFKERER